MKTFTERRQALNALERFTPGMEVEEKELPVGFLILAWFCFVGIVVHILAFGWFFLWLTLKS